MKAQDQLDYPRQRIGTVLAVVLALMMPVLSSQASELDFTEVTLDNQEAARRTIQAVRAPQAPEIDGDLSDAVWAEAAVINDFTQLQPSGGRAPTQRTEIRVLYDADYLYIGARMFDDSPDRIVANELIHGRVLANDDRLLVYVDPLDTGRRNYVFAVNGNGSQREGLGAAGSSFNMNWTGIWHARSRIDALGWTSEIAIPFRTLSFDPGREDWGLTIFRGVARTGEQTAWSFRDFSITNDSYGQLRGLRDIEQGMGLDIVPSVVLRERRSYADERSERRLEPSLDAFYRWTPSLIGALTLNTDFSGTDVDDRQVNLTRFSLFLPERREFFLQDADIFEFADLQQNGRPFFSRTLGLSSQGTPVDLIAGAKLTGRVGGRWNLGILAVQQDADGDIDADLLMAARASVDVLENSSMGMMATYGDPRSNLESWLVGADWNFRNVGWLGDGRQLESGAWVQRSYTEGATGDDMAWGLRFTLPNDRLELRTSVVELQQNFRPAMGFVNRRAIRQYDGSLYQRWREPIDLLRFWRMGMEVQQVHDLDGRLESASIRAVPVDVQFASGESINVFGLRRREVLDRAFGIVADLVIDPGIYEFHRVGITLKGAGYRRFAPVLTLESGTFFDGRREDATISTSWAPSRYLIIDASYAVNRLLLDSGDFITRVISLRTNAAFNVQWAWTTSLQYDNVSQRLGVNTRLRYMPRFGQSLLLALTHDFDVLDDEDDRRVIKSRQRELSGRVNYTFRF